MDMLSTFQTHPAIFFSTVALLGLVVGSFLNVVILRLPVMMERAWRRQCAEFFPELTDQTQVPEPFNLITPRSRCPACGHRITALENIPVLSYLLLRGRCSACGRRISIRYPVIEAATAIFSLIVAWRFGVSWETLTALIITWALIAASVIDIEHQLLPDIITLPFLWLGLLINIPGLFTDVTSAIIGAVAGYLLLWSVYWLFKLLTRKEGMGYGDFKLLAALGAWTGWQFILPIVLISSLVGAVVGITLILSRGRDRRVPIPYGPYLAAAGWIVLLWGHSLVDAYWDWMGAGL
jgi:leader peptidase (prepilin peptidase)/N-methyltransferase